MPVDVEVRIVGLPELHRAFDDVADDLPGEIASANAEPTRAIAEAAGREMPRKSGAAADSIRAVVADGVAGLVFGGDSAPYEPWLDFGGNIGVGGSIERGYVQGGRYLYPAIDDAEDELVKAADTAVERAAEKHGFETRGGQ